MAKLQISLKARALRYLSAREHSRIELARKLARYAQEGDDVDALLNALEAANFLSEQRFTESLIHRRAARFGNSRILAELQNHGIQDEALQETKVDLAADEQTRAVEVWRKKFGKLAETPEERAKQIRFLASRGFSMQSIKLALQTEIDED